MNKAAAMNKEIPDAAIVGIVLAVIAVLGFLIYRSTGPEPVSRVDPKVMRDRMVQGRSQMGGASSQRPQAGRERMMRQAGMGQQQRSQYQPPQSQAPPPR